MGDLSRWNAADKNEKTVKRLYKEELKNADVIVTIVGGVPQVEVKNKDVRVLLIDYDNVEESDTKEWTRVDCEENFVTIYGSKS